MNLSVVLFLKRDVKKWMGRCWLGKGKGENDNTDQTFVYGLNLNGRTCNVLRYISKCIIPQCCLKKNIELDSLSTFNFND